MIRDPARQRLLGSFSGGNAQDDRRRALGRSGKIKAVQPEKDDDCGERRPLVAVDKRIARDAVTVGGSKGS